MTRLIIILAVLLALLGAWGLFEYYQHIKAGQAQKQNRAAASVVVPERLPGMPAAWEPSLQAAKQQGPEAFRNWLRMYGRGLQDPRKAWIELDYCVMIVRDNPAEARRIFAEVKKRTPRSSPVWPRIQELDQSYR